ncbi:MAG: glycosyltransferase family 1 protein, partial [bacterium]
EEFLLAVGTIEPRKNLNFLVTAFEQFTRARPDSKLKLVIAGGRGWLTNPFFENIQKSAARDRIVITDYLHDAELRALYSSCRAFVYPSLYEGFGLPPLEAMACGAPVIASRIPALVEIASEAASFFEPTEVADLLEAILALLEDANARKKFSLAGQARAAEFSWQKAAHRTLEVYKFALREFSARR